MEVPTAWCDDSWVPVSSLALKLDDWGVLQAATIVDRLRTVDGKPCHLDEHVRRFATNCKAIGLAAQSPESLSSIIGECVQRNCSAFGNKDYSVVLLATPGRHLRDPSTQTLIVYPVPISWRRLAAWYTHGQALLISRHRNVPSECWSPEIKTRSRLHYFLADRQAELVESDAAAWLLDTQSHLTETSVANVLLVEGDQLVGPPAGGILPGVGLKTTLRLARQAGIPYSEELFSYERAASATEILLCGGSAFLWPARQLWRTKSSMQSEFEPLSKYPRPTESPMYMRLKSAWERELGLNYVEQAIDFAEES